MIGNRLRLKIENKKQKTKSRLLYNVSCIAFITMICNKLNLKKEDLFSGLLSIFGQTSERPNRNLNEPLNKE